MNARGKKRLALATLVLSSGFVFAPTAQAERESLGRSGGLSYFTDTFAVPASDSSRVEIQCPGDNGNPVGAGIDLGGGPEASYISGITSFAFGHMSTVAWDGFGFGSSARGYAICKRFTVSANGSAYVGVGVPEGPATETATVPCDNGRLFGGGGFFAGEDLDTWYLTSTYPSGNGWTWSGYHYPGSESSEIYAEAYCVNGGPPREIEKDSVETNRELVRLKVFCEEGVVSSGGGSASKEASKSHMTKTVPIDGNDNGTVPDDGWAVEWENDGLVRQKFTVYAVCG